MSYDIVFPHDHVILDASCVINLYESGMMGEILASLQAFIAIVDYVYQDEISPAERGSLPLFQALIESGLLVVASFESEDENDYFCELCRLYG